MMFAWVLAALAAEVRVVTLPGTTCADVVVEGQARGGAPLPVYTSEIRVGDDLLSRCWTGVTFGNADGKEVTVTLPSPVDRHLYSDHLSGAVVRNVGKHTLHRLSSSGGKDVLDPDERRILAFARSTRADGDPKRLAVFSFEDRYAIVLDLYVRDGRTGHLERMPCGGDVGCLDGVEVRAWPKDGMAAPPWGLPESEQSLRTLEFTSVKADDPLVPGIRLVNVADPAIAQPARGDVYLQVDVQGYPVWNIVLEHAASRGDPNVTVLRLVYPRPPETPLPSAPQ